MVSVLASRRQRTVTLDASHVSFTRLFARARAARTRNARGSASITRRRMGGRSSNSQLAASSPARRTMASYPASSRLRKLKTARTPDT